MVLIEKFYRTLIPSKKNEGQAGETGFWLGWPTRQLPKPAHVLSKSPDSLALGLVLLAYSIGLVQTVRGGHATCCVCGPQNPGTDMPNSLSIYTDFPVSSCAEAVTSSTGKSTLLFHTNLK